MPKTDQEKLNLSPETEKEIKTTVSHKSENRQETGTEQGTKNNTHKKRTMIDSKNKDNTNEGLLKNPVANPMWLSISEAAKIGGVNTKTIRRAIQSEKIKYTIYKNRYLIGLRSLIIYLHSNTKLKNKLNFNGIGQYIKKWR